MGRPREEYLAHAEKVRREHSPEESRRLSQRLAEIERQVLIQQKHLDEWSERAHLWLKFADGECRFATIIAEPPEIDVGCTAPDYCPDLEGPLFLPIIDAPNATEDET